MGNCNPLAATALGVLVKCQTAGLTYCSYTAIVKPATEKVLNKTKPIVFESDTEGYPGLARVKN